MRARDADRRVDQSHASVSVAFRETPALEPHVVAEISYAEIVQGRLRAQVFRGFAERRSDTGG